MGHNTVMENYVRCAVMLLFYEIKQSSGLEGTISIFEAICHS